jgi:uncharacterized repeat protein (TIGR01451 family)
MKYLSRTLLAFVLVAMPLAAFAQSAAITRADFVVNMMASKGLYGNGGHCFPDVKNQAFAPVVCEAKARGYVSGFGDGRFHPYQQVTLVDAAVMAMRLEGVSLAYDALWYRPAIEKLGDWDAIPRSITSIAMPLSVSQANDILVAVRNRGDDNDENDDTTDDEDIDHDDDHDDLTVSISDNPTRVDEGDIIEYRIRIQNDDNDDVSVDVVAQLDDDVSFVSASDDGDEDGGEVEWDNVDIDDDDDVVLTLRVRVRSNAGDTVKLRVEADHEVDEELTDIRNGGSSVSSHDDIELSIDESDDPVESGDTMTYRIRIENNGNSDEDVDVEATLDDDMIFVSASEDGDEDDGTVEWDDIEVNEDDTETLLLTVRMRNTLDDGDTVTLRVNAAGQRETETTRIDDNNNGNDDDNDADVTVSITEADDPVEEGEVITYRIRITNNENQIIVIDPTAFLDGDTSFVSASDGGDLHGDDEVEWENISIARDDTKTLLLSVRPRSTVRDGDTVRLRVEAGDTDDSETTTIEDGSDSNDNGNEDLRVSITDSDDPARTGDTVTYRIRVENLDNDDTSVDVRARLDGDMVYVSSNEGGDISGSEVRWDNVNIDGDDDITLILNVRVRSTADDGDTIRLDVDAEGELESESTRIED